MSAHYVLASDPLAAWGQAAAIMLLIELFFFLLIGLALAAALMFGFSWVREKVELIKLLRPFVESVNVTAESSLKQQPLPASAPKNKAVRAVAELPGKVTKADEKVNEVSDKVAHAVIEFHGRTEMAKTVLRQTFLPGLKKPSKKSDFYAPGEDSPGYRAVTRRETLDDAAASEPGNGYLADVDAEALRNVPAH